MQHNPKQATQYRQNVSQVWAAVDPNLNIFPRSMLSNTDLIEDNFYYPLKHNLELNLKLPKEQRSSHIQASTIKSKLRSLSVFWRFLINCAVFIYLQSLDLEKIKSKVSELNVTLKKPTDQRFKVISRHKSRLLLTASDFKKYSSSGHVTEST